MSRGFVHLYVGNGKGKTTAAMGLALRALGAGQRVVCAQFLKNGGSGEIKMLKQLKGFTCLIGQETDKFVFQMNEAEKAACREACGKLLSEARACLDCADVVILDELCAALTLRLVGEDEVIELLNSNKSAHDIVITGRDPLPSLLERADYVSEISCIKHPYNQGILAREGIEY